MRHRIGSPASIQPRVARYTAHEAPLLRIFAGSRTSHPHVDAHDGTQDSYVAQPEDLALAQRAVGGDSVALDAVIERLRCVPPILAARNAQLGRPLDDHELADLAQDTLIVIWRKLPTFAGRAALESWAYRICALELMNALRKQHRRPRLVSSADERSPAAPELSVDRSPSAADYEHVYLGLERLGPPENEVVRLKHFEHLTFDDIAARMDISPNTAKTRYYRGLLRLRNLLEEAGAGDESEVAT